MGNRVWNTVLRKFGSCIMDIKCFVSKCKYTSSWLDIYYGICLSRTPRSDFIKYSIVNRRKNDINKGCSRCSRAMSMTRRGILSTRPSTTACGIPDSKVHGAHMGPNWGRQDPDGPHVGHVNLAIWDNIPLILQSLGQLRQCCWGLSENISWAPI